jgi:hypothetical protein
MSGSLTSGTYAHAPSIAVAIRKFVVGMWHAALTAPATPHGDYMGAAIQLRAHVRGTRQLEERRCIEPHSPNVEANE